MSSDRPGRRREIEESTAARLAEIVAAAERAAKQVIDEAEADARTRLSDAEGEADRIVAERLGRLGELTDEIGTQAAALVRRAEALQGALAQARSELGLPESRRGSLTGEGRESGPEDGAEPDHDPERSPGGEQEGNGRKPIVGPTLSVVGAPPLEDSRPPGTPAGARLLATQMAVSGSSREEIEARLRNGFAIEDPGPILDAILGPEH